MDFYKANIQSDGIIDKLKLIIVVRGHFQNKYMIGDTLATTSSMITLKYFLADSDKQKERVHQLDFIVSFLQSNLNHGVFLRMTSRYGE